MLRVAPTTRVRTAAVSASTLFGITLAILAGLLFALVFKVTLLNPRDKTNGNGIVMSLAEKGERMPQKSTFFYPKLASGLVNFDLDLGPSR